jgi:hypothetical protein
LQRKIWHERIQSQLKVEVYVQAPAPLARFDFIGAMRQSRPA